MRAEHCQRCDTLRATAARQMGSASTSAGGKGRLLLKPLQPPISPAWPPPSSLQRWRCTRERWRCACPRRACQQCGRQAPLPVPPPRWRRPCAPRCLQSIRGEPLFQQGRQKHPALPLDALQAASTCERQLWALPARAACGVELQRPRNLAPTASLQHAPAACQRWCSCSASAPQYNTSTYALPAPPTCMPQPPRAPPKPPAPHPHHTTSPSRAPQNQAHPGPRGC